MSKERQEQLTNKRYPGIDCLKYVAAILVIVVHTSPLFPHMKWLSYTFSNGIGRLAVPIFFLASGFLVRERLKKAPAYFKRYLKKLGKVYGWWSLFYLPLGFLWLNQNVDIPWFLYPLALLVGFFYAGTYYHLWYVPALMFALVIVNWLLKRWNYKVVLTLSGMLYLLGCLETYYSLLTNTYLIEIVDSYMKIFQTTRNGLFFGMIFVALGFFVSDHSQSLAKYAKVTYLVPCLGLLIAELCFIFDKPRLDANFLVMFVPVALLLLLIAKDWQVKLSQERLLQLNQWTNFYYFGHLFVLFFWTKLSQSTSFKGLFQQNGWLRFILVLVTVHCLGLMWQKVGTKLFQVTEG